MKSISKIPFANGVEGLINQNRRYLSESIRSAFDSQATSSLSLQRDLHIQELLRGKTSSPLLGLAQKVGLKSQTTSEKFVTSLREKSTALLLEDVPDYLNHLKHMLNWYNYPGKFQSTMLLGNLVALGYLKDKESSSTSPSLKLQRLIACTEAMGLGEHLFMHTEHGTSLLAGLPSALSRIVASKVSEKNIMLSADFFFASAAKRSVSLGSDEEVYILSCINELHFTVTEASYLRK